MSIRDVLKKSFLEGFSTDITTTKVLVTLGITLILACYIFMIYKLKSRSVFYSKNFNITTAVVSVITASIVLAMQSNIVVSLGMVGALSIVRFRSAIKNPMDLMYLFWSISTGIVCGAGLYEIAVITCVVVTIALLLLDLLPVNRPPYLLVINSGDRNIEQKLIEPLKKYTRYYRVKSRNISQNQINLIIELRTGQEAALLEACGKLPALDSFSLLTHDGEIQN